MFTTLLSVAAGGAIGASMRYGLSLLIGGTMAWPLWAATLLANILGCAVMGGLAAYLMAHPQYEVWRPFMLIGLCGALTTFSSFTLDSFTLFDKGAYGTLVTYISLSVFSSLFVFFAAYYLVRLGMGGK